MASVILWPWAGHASRFFFFFFVYSSCFLDCIHLQSFHPVCSQKAALLYSVGRKASAKVLKNTQTTSRSETKYRIPSDQAIPTNCPLFSLLAPHLHFQPLASSTRHHLQRQLSPVPVPLHTLNSSPDTLLPLSTIAAAWKQGQQGPSSSHCLATRSAVLAWLTESKTALQGSGTSRFRIPNST